MSVFSAQDVQVAAGRVSAFTFEESERFIQQFNKKQRKLVFFTGAYAERNFNDEEEEIFVYLMMVIWLLFLERFPGMQMIELDELKEKIGHSSDSIGSRERMRKSAWLASARKTASEGEEPHILQFALDTILQSDHVRDGAKKSMFVEVNAILDCLLRAAES